MTTETEFIYFLAHCGKRVADDPSTEFCSTVIDQKNSQCPEQNTAYYEPCDVLNSIIFSEM